MIPIATKLLPLLVLAVLAVSLLAVLVPSARAVVSFTFCGVYEDGTTSLLPDNATVRAHFTNGAIADYSVNNGTTIGVGNVPIYFEYSYNLSGTILTRQYWLSDSEKTGGATIYMYAATGCDSVAFNVINMRSIGAFDEGGFLISRAASSMPPGIIEKVPIDYIGDAKLELKQYVHYDISVEAISDGSLYEFGNLDIIASSLTLSLPSSAFPEETLLQYPYVTFYGYRDFTTNSILLMYNDTKAQTNNFTATFTDSGGTVVATYNVASTNNLSYNWTSAVDTETYYVNVAVEHGLYGDLSWSQTFYEEGGSDTQKFSLNFLGDWSFNTAYIIPALIVLFIACCFSVLNAEAGALLSTVAAIILTVLGWLPIPAGMLVSAFAFSILMALVYNKRRSGMY